MNTASPSALPHLAACRCYQPAPGCTAAAKRGTRIDKAIRESWLARTGGTLFDADFFLDDLTAKDRAAVDWAIQKLDESLRSHGSPLFVEGAAVQAGTACPGINGGTMDAIQPHSRLLIDFKTGQHRDYKPQMAAYAAACMRRYNADEWTARLLFVDSEQEETHHFSRESALAIVKSILEKPETPTPGQHCSWCGAKCHARILGGRK